MAEQNAIEKALQSESAQETVLVANTPSFLLDRLKKDSGVQYLVQALPAEKIYSMLSEMLNQQQPMASEDLVREYVLLIALLSSKWQERWEAARRLDLGKLQWGNLLLALSWAEEIPTATSKVQRDLVLA